MVFTQTVNRFWAMDELIVVHYLHNYLLNSNMPESSFQITGSSLLLIKCAPKYWYKLVGTQ